jgi:hypothetical protein
MLDSVPVLPALDSLLIPDSGVRVPAESVLRDTAR